MLYDVRTDNAAVCLRLEKGAKIDQIQVKHMRSSVPLLGNCFFVRVIGNTIDNYAVFFKQVFSECTGAHAEVQQHIACRNHFRDACQRVIGTSTYRALIYVQIFFFRWHRPIMTCTDRGRFSDLANGSGCCDELLPSGMGVC